jgi:cell division inhibitor SepF
MTFFKKAMNYLGLGPDDAYDDYDAPVEADGSGGTRSSYGPDVDSGTVRTVQARGNQRDTGAAGRPGGGEEPPAVSVRPRGGSAVRTMAATAGPPKPHTVRPRRFDQAQEVADKFKEGQPVIVNLQDVERDLSRRLIDFASGLCYGLDGTMEKVGHGMYLLTPASVSAEDRRLLTERDAHD